MPFAAGATVDAGAPGQQPWWAEELASFLREHHVTCMACSPTLLSSIERRADYAPSSRRWQACSPGLVVRWARPAARFSTYGPTETAVTATMALLTPEAGDDRRTRCPPIRSPSSIRKPEVTDDELGQSASAAWVWRYGYLNRQTDRPEIHRFIGLPNNPSGRISIARGDLGRINDRARSKLSWPHRHAPGQRFAAIIELGRGSG